MLNHTTHTVYEVYKLATSFEELESMHNSVQRGNDYNLFKYENVKFQGVTYPRIELYAELMLRLGFCKINMEMKESLGTLMLWYVNQFGTIALAHNDSTRADLREVLRYSEIEQSMQIFY